MKKLLIIAVISLSTLNLISCSKVTDQSSITNKYPIDDYLKKGATLDYYEQSGTAVLKDTNGQKFFAGSGSTYKAVLNDKGVLLPYIVTKDNIYYFEENITNKDLPTDLSTKKLSTIGGNLEEFIPNIDPSQKNILRNLVVYADKDNLIYTTYKGIDGYQVWTSNKN